MKKTIYYWSPCLAKVATIKATMNSAVSLAKYSTLYDVKILDVCGEWSMHKDYLSTKKVNVKKLTFNYYKYLPKNGFIKSRISNLIIILISFFPLFFLLKNKKPDYFIIHLVTSLPLLLINFFYTKTKFILRISGLPKLNFFRKKLWTYSKNKLFKVTCPTDDLRNNLIEENVFDINKLNKLPDPVINIEEFLKKKNDKNTKLATKKNFDFFIAAGRLTKQKNFFYLINEFKKFLNVYPNEKLLIFGDGELKEKLQNEIRNKNISGNVKLCGYTDNIYKQMLSSKAFIMSSLWEDPGFVMIESALCNLFIISSDCKNGPKEFLLNGKAGFIFKSNVENKLFEKLKDFKKLKNNSIIEKKILAKKNSMKFTMFRHFLLLKDIIENK
tara:strand:- start:2652 stop:3806 length:1155 start_codon:yes stop_codon:yes gene_type:complete